MAEPFVIEWDADALPSALRALLPTALRELPSGRYLVQPVADDDELTLEEEAGILAAIAEIEDGKGIPWETALRQLRSSTSR